MGAAMAGAGGLLMYRGIRQQRTPHLQEVHVQRSISVDRPVEELFQFWRNLENLPRFMRHLRSVTKTSDRYSHWVARAPIGTSVEWDAEILEEEPNRYIIWRSLPGAMVPNTGSVMFRPASQYHGGTEIYVAIDFDSPGGKLGAKLATIFGENPEQQIREDLRRFKQLMEAGEIPTTEGQPHGRRTAFVRMVQAVASDEPKRVEERTLRPHAV